MQLDWDFRIQPPRWVVHFETTGSVNVLLCLQQENSFIWNTRSVTESKIFYFSISTQSLRIAVKTCFSKRCFLLILVHRRICSIRYLPLLWCFWVLNKYGKVLKHAVPNHPKLDGFSKIYLMRKLVKYKRDNNQLKYWHGLKMKGLKD